MFDRLVNITWDNFHFLRPEFLWLFIALVVLLIVNLIAQNEQIKWENIIAPHLRTYMIKRGNEHYKKWMQLSSLLVLSIAIFGLAGPVWKKIEIPGKTLETPLVIVVDLSQSMMANDIQPNRLERAKFKVKDLLDANPRARVALIGFAGSAHTIVPLTHDYKIVNTHIASLSPNIMPFAGTNLGIALALADTISQVTSAPGTLLLISDEFTDETFDLLQNFVAQSDTKIEIMPMNTLSGSEIPNQRGSRPLRNQQGNIVHSALDMNIIEKLNSIEDINVNHLTLDKSDMELLAKKISANLSFTEQDGEKEDDWQDHGIWFAFPLALGLLLSFRKGWVIYSFLILFGFSSCSSESTFKDLWLSRDFQAQQNYKNGEYEEAANLFASEMRKGIAYFKAGDYDEAIKAFSQDTTAEGAYNLGIAFYENGDFAAAERSFGIALEKDPDMEAAQANQMLSQQLSVGSNEVSLEDAQEAEKEQGSAQNEQNKSPEDLSGGGQEATKEDMEKERLEETVDTDVRKGKELDEVPENFESGKMDESQKVLMRKVDDDPALFLKRKFAHQVKKDKIKVDNKGQAW